MANGDYQFRLVIAKLFRSVDSQLVKGWADFLFGYK